MRGDCGRYSRIRSEDAPTSPHPAGGGPSDPRGGRSPAFHRARVAFSVLPKQRRPAELCRPSTPRRSLPDNLALCAVGCATNRRTRRTIDGVCGRGRGEQLPGPFDRPSRGLFPAEVDEYAAVVV